MLVVYSPMVTTQPMPSRTSDVVLTYVVSDKAGLPKLIQRATDESLSFGWTRATMNNESHARFVAEL